MKGQLFSLDALLALLAVTIALGLIVTQAEALHNNPLNELQTLASDWSQIAVKKTLAVNEPNNLSSANLNLLKNEMDSIFTGTIYNYEAELNDGIISNSIQRGTGCSTANEVGAIKRAARVDGKDGYLLMKVCK